MTINYNVTGTERKRLADYIAGFLGTEKKYLGAPTFSYQVGYITVSKDGTVSWDDHDSLLRETSVLRAELEKEGFHAEPVADTGADAEQADKVADHLENADSGEQGASVGLTVEVPLDKVHLGNLTSLLDAKGGLIQKALGIDATPIQVTENRVTFPWFAELPEPDTASAYTNFISALCAMSVAQKRVTAKPKTIDNEKYAFRCFLLRLGFIGTEYKAERKILLKNLSGSSAFKSGARREVGSNVVS